MSARLLRLNAHLLRANTDPQKSSSQPQAMRAKPEKPTPPRRRRMPGCKALAEVVPGSDLGWGSQCSVHGRTCCHNLRRLQVQPFRPSKWSARARSRSWIVRCLIGCLTRSADGAVAAVGTVAQASCLWGRRGVPPAGCKAAGRMPAGPTAGTAVPRFAAALPPCDEILSGNQISMVPTTGAVSISVRIRWHHRLISSRPFGTSRQLQSPNAPFALNRHAFLRFPNPSMLGKDGICEIADLIACGKSSAFRLKYHLL